MTLVSMFAYVCIGAVATLLAGSFSTVAFLSCGITAVRICMLCISILIYNILYNANDRTHV